MNYYKDLNNQVYALDSTDDEHFLPVGCTGITLEEADVLRASPPPTLEQQVASAKQAVQAHLDKIAQDHGYDSILSACSYAAVVNQFQTESIHFIEWRSAVWVAAQQVFNDVTNSVRTIPTIEQLIAELPVFTA
jgi:hypothetical protein